MTPKTLFLALAISIAIQSPEPSEEDWRWLDRFRHPALDTLMPFAPQHLVAYRSYRDLHQDVHERYFAIAYAEGDGFDRDRLVATVVTPIGESIQQQLLDLHMKKRDASFEALISEVAVRRDVLTADKCPAIRTRLDQLSKVAISLPERDVFFLHPVLHRIVIDMGAAQVDATIHDHHNPVIRWAIETNDALLACVTR